MQVMAVNSVLHSNVPVSILQGLTQIQWQDSLSILDLKNDSPDDSTVRRVDSTASAKIDGMSEIRNAFVAALKVGELIQSASLLEPIR